MVMKFPYSFLVKREKSLSSCAAHNCTAGFLVLSRTWHVVSRQPLTAGPRGTYADVIELHGVGVLAVSMGFVDLGGWDIRRTAQAVSGSPAARSPRGETSGSGDGLRQCSGMWGNAGGGLNAGRLWLSYYRRIARCRTRFVSHVSKVVERPFVVDTNR